MMKRWAVLLATFMLILAVSSRASRIAADYEQDRLKVGLQPDGRIVVPTNQILSPAGTQIKFPGRPVDLALLPDGLTLVVKNRNNLLFVDLAEFRSCRHS